MPHRLTDPPNAHAASEPLDNPDGEPIVRQPWSPLVACCLGTFLLLLYTSIVTVALPAIGDDLHANSVAQQWIIDVYSLALAGLLLGAGSFSDVLGDRRVHLLGLLGFTMATLTCGLASSPVWLICARAAQGVAGAAMFATILPLIGLTYIQPQQRATAFAIWGAVAGAASAFGTVFGGALVEYAGWRWMFLGALPLCGLALAMSLRSLPTTIAARRSRRPLPDIARIHRMCPRHSRIDWPGVVAATAAVTALAYSVIVGGESGWTAPESLVGWFIAGGAIGGFVLAERFAPRPLLPLELFRRPQITGVLAVAFGYYFAAFGALPAIATWLQTSCKMRALPTSFLLVVQLGAFIAVSGLISGRLHRRHPRWTLSFSTTVIGVGAVTSAALLTAVGRANWPALLPFLIISGIGSGIVSPVLPAVAIAAAPSSYAGTAGAACNAARQLGLALGVAVCGSLSDATTATGPAPALVVGGAIAVLAGGVSFRLLRRDL